MPDKKAFTVYVYITVLSVCGLLVYVTLCTIQSYLSPPSRTVPANYSLFQPWSEPGCNCLDLWPGLSYLQWVASYTCKFMTSPVMLLICLSGVNLFVILSLPSLPPLQTFPNSHHTSYNTNALFSLFFLNLLCFFCFSCSFSAFF